MYRDTSSMDGGTLHQLKNLVNRKNLPKKPKNDMNACEDFFQLVGIAHVAAAAIEMYVDSETSPLQSLDPKTLDLQQKTETLHRFARDIVDRNVNLHLVDGSSCATSDGVLDYAREVLTLALLYAEFHDAIREGDGDRIIGCWKFLLLLFKASKRTNYSLEALNFLAQYYIFLSPRLAQQLAWSRCVNTTGRKGCNIPMDLHMEHLNRSCKTAVANLGANATPKAIVRIGRCIGPLTDLCTAFDHCTGVAALSGLVHRTMVFKCTPGRKHNAFRTFSGSLLDKLSKCELEKWMQGHLNRMK